MNLRVTAECKQMNRLDAGKPAGRPRVDENVTQHANSNQLGHIDRVGGILPHARAQRRRG